MNWLKFFVFVLISTKLLAMPLTKEDMLNLKKRTKREHILYETYLETDNGLASVFGYQFDTYFNKNQAFILAISGAVNGDRGGYGFAAFGLGQIVPLNDQFMLNLRCFIGSGGGGGLDAGGGFMVELHAGIMFNITDGLGVQLNSGYLKYPTGTFETPMVNFGIYLTEETIYLPFL